MLVVLTLIPRNTPTYCHWYNHVPRLIPVPSISMPRPGEANLKCACAPCIRHVVPASSFLPCIFRGKSLDQLPVSKWIAVKILQELICKQYLVLCVGQWCQPSLECSITGTPRLVKTEDKFCWCYHATTHYPNHPPFCEQRDHQVCFISLLTNPYILC